MTARTERIARQVLLRHYLPLHLSAEPTDLSGLQPDSLRGECLPGCALRQPQRPHLPLRFLRCGGGLRRRSAHRATVPKKITLRILQ